MSMTDIQPPESFEQQLQACLTHLYDYAFLFNHPLVVWFAPYENSVKRVQQFRSRITTAIEQMRPGEHVSYYAREARPYNVLTLRYIDGLDTDEALTQLALSRRQFFREHARALEILAAVLQDETPTPDTVPPLSLETEIAALYQNSQQEAIDIDELLSGVIASVQRLADQHRVTVQSYPTRDGQPFFADRTLLRQMLLSLVSFLLTRCTEGSVLRLQRREEDAALEIDFNLSGTGIDADAFTADLLAQEALQAVVRALNARLDIHSDAADQVEFRLTLHSVERTILVIDDNPDVLELLRRYVANRHYRLITATTGDTGIAAALSKPVDVIILDIMLPGQDGYEVLQTLKHHPQTQYIAILICTVLEGDDLALSLGADGYLKKPPGQTELLTLLDRWLA